LQLVYDLKQQGVTVLYVSHRLEEVFRISDRITVLKDGHRVATVTTRAVSHDDVVRMMVGRELAAHLYPPHGQANDDAVLRVRNLSVPGALEDVSLELRRGEIIGIAGLVGSGRTSLARAIFGAAKGARGEFYLHGKRVRIRSPRDAARIGIALLTEDRKSEGLAMNLDGTRNITAVRLARRALRRSVRTLSGGNQQKTVLAKWLAARPRVLIFDEPTRGIDVGTKAEIYTMMRQLADEGVAILFISSELSEILGLSDRILVMRQGRIVAELDASKATEEGIMRAAVVEETS
jgi:ribose transport system ATP-binding protein